MDAGGRMRLGKSQPEKQPTHKKPKTGQDADPPARFASYHSKDSKANSQRGQSPTRKTKRFAKDTVVKTHCVTIKTKTCSKRIMPPRNVRHANYVVASKATRSRVHYTLETNPASQSPLTSTCSRAQIQRKTKYQLA